MRRRCFITSCSTRSRTALPDSASKGVFRLQLGRRVLDFSCGAMLVHVELRDGVTTRAGRFSSYRDNMIAASNLKARARDSAVSQDAAGGSSATRTAQASGGANTCCATQPVPKDVGQGLGSDGLDQALEHRARELI